MILRTWHGTTPIGDADAYEQFMRERAAPDYGSIPGLRRVVFTRRDDGTITHFLLVTIWEDLDAVKRFAGGDPSKAKYYKEDDTFLIDKEELSLNHIIFYDSEALS